MSSFFDTKAYKGDQNIGLIEQSRCTTHRIIDINQELGHCSFTRNSRFPYTYKGKDKIYQKKIAELKIEKYARYDQ